MSGRMRRRERGYVLAEALVGGAVMMLAIAGVMGAFAQASEQMSRATADQRAAQLALEQVERLRMRPASSAEWNVGTTDCVTGNLPEAWSCTIEVEEVTDGAVAGPVTGTLQYKRGVVTVGYRGTQWTLEALKW